MADNLTFILKPGSTFTQTYEGEGTVVHQGGTPTGRVTLTPRQAQVLKAGTPGSIFQPIGQIGGNQQQEGQDGAQEGTQGLESNEEVGEAVSQGSQGNVEASTQVDVHVSALLSRSVKDIVTEVEKISDKQLITALHAKESNGANRKGVIDVLNARYDVLESATK